MSKVTSHYEEAIRLARTTYVKGNTQVALGLTSTVPTDASGWIAIFNRGDNLAPGGGLAYQGAVDDAAGAVGVVSTDELQVAISRPNYEQLSSETTTVVAASER